MALSYKNDEKKDERLDPYSDSARDLYKQEHDSVPGYDRANDGLDDHPITAGDASGKPGDIGDAPTKNIDAASQKEREGGGSPMNYTGPDSKNAKAPVTAKDWVKKKGPMAVLLAVTAGGGGIIAGILSTFGLAPVHFKETYFNDLNDQAAALDIRKDIVTANRLKADTTAGLCTTKLSFNCRYKRFGKPFIDRLVKDGHAEVTCAAGDCNKRFNNKITSIRFPDGTLVDDPSKFRSVMLRNTNARSVMNRAYNPVFYSMWDGPARKALVKMGITKAKKLTSNNVEKNKETLRQAGNIPSKDGKPLIPKHGNQNNPNEVTGYTDSSGKEYSVEEGNKINEATRSLESVGGGAANRLVRGVVGSVGVIGAANTACHAIKSIELVSMGAKSIRTAQAILATEPLLNSADAIKAGKEIPEAATAVGEILTETNTAETTIDDNGNKIPNPNKGLGAFDSIGYKASAGFVTAPKLTSADSIYMVGTPTTGVLDTLSRMARNVVNPSACGVIQNPWVQAGSVIVGVAAAIFTGGLSTTQIVAQGAFAVAVAVGMAYVEAMLQDMAAGNMEDNFHDVGVGNTAFVGTSEITQRIGGARGMGYQTDENIDEFNSLRAEVNERHVAVEKSDAQKDPFNPLLQYSFAGIAARQLLPLQYTGSLPSKFLAVAALPVRSLQSILSPTTYALDIKSPYHRERFEQCKDPAYVELGIKADIFCNLRRAMTKKELALDSIQVANWMIAKGYIDDTANAEGVEIDTLARGDYKKFLDSCVSQSDIPPDVSQGGDNWANKKNCVKPVDIDQDTLSNFRVTTLDYSVIDGMDNEAQSIGSATGQAPTVPGGLVTGDAKDLARQVTNNPNIVFVKPATKTSLENFANTGQAINSCGQPFTIDPVLTGVILTLSSKYRVYIGNFGFNNDRSFCDTGQHPKGKAIDINGIEAIGGGKTSWGQIRFTANELPVLTSYANDWLAALPPNRGGVGQKGCNGFTITPPPGAVNVNGSMFFADSCNHLHIDVRER